MPAEASNVSESGKMTLRADNIAAIAALRCVVKRAVDARRETVKRAG